MQCICVKCSPGICPSRITNPGGRIPSVASGKCEDFYDNLEGNTDCHMVNSISNDVLQTNCKGRLFICIDKEQSNDRLIALPLRINGTMGSRQRRHH
jgi:hypothetical protein